MADDDIVLTWIQALTARGISIEARGTRVAVKPKSAYSSVMTEDERRVMKDERAEIVALLNDTYGGTAEAVRSLSLEEPSSDRQTPEPQDIKPSPGRPSSEEIKDGDGLNLSRTDVPSEPEPRPAPIPRPVCPHCGSDLSNIEPGTPRFDHMLACARRHEDPEVERRRREATAVMLATMRHGSGITTW
jgi:hypothetical protein